MRKIAVIVPESTAEKIEIKAREQGVSLGAVCCDTLVATFDPGAKKKLEEREAQLTKVEEEISYFLTKLEVGDRFSIVEASETFRNFRDNHSPTEALNLKKQVGRRLRRKVGVRGTVFEYVAMAVDDDNEPIKNTRTHAIQYQVMAMDDKDKNEKE